MVRFLVTFILATLLLTACDVNKRDPRTPPPTVKRVSTDFFFKFSPDRKTYSSRRFIMGVSPEDMVGRFQSIHMNHWNSIGSANIEFDFNDEGTKLIGKMVNPSYPNDKEKWQELVSFVVSRSYYEENIVDGAGRTSNDRVQRSDKSDPRARPFIDLEFSSMQFLDKVKIGPMSGLTTKVIQRVYDVEWGEEGKFLGFTTESTSALLGSHAQTIDRVNLLRIEPENPDFQETYYDEMNSKHIALVGLVSSRPNVFGQRMKAGHWNINENSKKKHKIYLHNFPTEPVNYLQVAIDAIESWNDVFADKDMVGYRPFEYEVTQRKYAFDLRYHTIHWEDDLRLSATGTNGLANMIMDVTNGEVLWTGSIIWGGMIDQRAASTIPSFAGPGVASGVADAHSMAGVFPTVEGEGVRSLPSLSWNKPVISANQQEDYRDFTDFLTERFEDEYSRASKEYINAQIEAKRIELGQLIEAEELSVGDANDRLNWFKESVKFPSDMVTARELKDLLTEVRSLKPVNHVDLKYGYEFLSDEPITYKGIQAELGLYIDQFNQRNFTIPNFDNNSWIFKDPMISFKMPNQLANSHSHMPEGMIDTLHDADHDFMPTLERLNFEIRKQMAKGIPVDLDMIKKGMIRRTIVHEIGHTLGLGHNFKANILPEKGSVPDNIYASLKKDAENGMINRSTIMGYPHPKTTLRTPYEEQKPGFNDISRLRYLYKREYPIYDKTTDGQSNYEWVAVKEDGKIRSRYYSEKAKKWLTPGFLPNCGTMEAFFYHDPYCNTHDRGYNAQTIMENLFNDYWDNLIMTLESKIDSLTISDYRRVNKFLWDSSAITFSRGRLFHDFMRLKYADEILKLKDTSDDDITRDNVLEFSDSCWALKDMSSSELENQLDDEKYSRFIQKQSDGSYKVNEFGDLCIATKSFYRNVTDLLNVDANDYGEVEHFERFLPEFAAGDYMPNTSQEFGRWKKLGIMPMKVKIMQNLLLPFSLMFIREKGDMFNPTYYRHDTAFSMATLYPKEFLTSIRALVQNGVTLVEDVEEGYEPSLSDSLRYLGFFLRFQSGTNDYRIFPNLLDAVANQTRFGFANSIIRVTAQREDDGTKAKVFTGRVYSRNTNHGDEDLGPVYLFTKKRVVLKSHTSSLILQVTPLRWNRPNEGGAFAVKADYSPDPDYKALDNYSPRRFFIDEYKKVIKTCVDGDEDRGTKGLSAFFKKIDEFEGIDLPPDIHRGTEGVHERLNDSIKTQLTNFETTYGVKKDVCEKALKTQKALVLGAGLMNGLIYHDTEKALPSGVNQ